MGGDMMSLGKRLKCLRNDEDKTQKQIAEILGIGHHALSYYERDEREPDIKTLVKIADYYNVTTDYLLCRVDIRDEMKEISFCFGDRLRELRIKSNLTQSQLGEKLNLSKANISKYEAGTIEPNIDIIIFLSNYFDVTIDYLLGKSDFYHKTEEKSNVIFSKRFKQLRNYCSLTQKEMAEILNLSPSTIGMYEQGRRVPDLYMLKEIIDNFNITADFLLGRSSDNSVMYDGYTNVFLEAKKHNVTPEELMKAITFINGIK
ncbi:MAG: helix-turn-helix transcriptional regulator [Firmicutes bacterium]|nr:helix-turn-helix transcriptional regulator [Bacillota bacterium]